MNSNLTLIKLSSDYYSKFDNFLLSKKNTLLFNCVGYQLLVCDTIGSELETVIVIDSEGEIQGALPLTSKRGSSGKVYNSFAFYGSNGGYIYNTVPALLLLKEFYNELSKKEDTCLAMISENPLERLIEEVGDIIDDRLCQFTKLDHESGEEGLMDSFHYKTRNMVRKSQKQGLEVVEDNSDITFLYETHYENMTAIGGKPKPEIFFKKIEKYFKAGVDYKIFLAKKDGVKISALLLFYFNGVVEYFTPVIKAEYRNLQPNTLLIYHTMAEASKSGFRLWNWGGTWKSQEDLYRFKSRWGAFDVAYNYYVRIKNKEILNSTPEKILNEYAYFFTVPFNLLNAGK